MDYTYGEPFPLRYADDPDEDALACPTCGWGCTHIERVLVAARREDAPVTPILVDAIASTVDLSRDLAIPGHEGRRQRIALIGHCECGHDFVIVFTQHKGGTYVEVSPLDDPRLLGSRRERQIEEEREWAARWNRERTAEQ